MKPNDGLLGITIEKMEEEHIEGVWELERASFARPWSRATLLMELVNPLSSCYVALCQGRVVGYVGLWCILDEGHINNIAILPAFRGRGYAKALMEYVLGQALGRGLSQVSLEVRPSNEAARRLYRRYGFQDIGRRKGYYENGEDAVIMAVRLGGVENAES